MHLTVRLTVFGPGVTLVWMSEDIRQSNVTDLLLLDLLLWVPAGWLALWGDGAQPESLILAQNERWRHA